MSRTIYACDTCTARVARESNIAAACCALLGVMLLALLPAACLFGVYGCVCVAMSFVCVLVIGWLHQVKADNIVAKLKDNIVYKHSELPSVLANELKQNPHYDGYCHGCGSTLRKEKY